MSGRWNGVVMALRAQARTCGALVLVALALPALSATPAERQAAARQAAAKAGAVTVPAAARGGPSAIVPVASTRRAAKPTAKSAKTAKTAKARALAAKGVRATRVAAVPAVPSVGRLTGLHAVSDPLDLKSGVALVVDQDSHQVLLSKNPDAVLPIASITKLMTALVVVESGLALDEMLSISQDDVEQTLNTRSRLLPGTSLTRGEMLRLALMSSENRAAHALSRQYPGGSAAFVAAMNRKAQDLGMGDSRFVESTGLSADNRASALDLTRLVAAASAHDVIRDYSTSKESLVPVGVSDKVVQFRSTNGLIGNPEWDILLQKTGYISAAGRCLVMQAQLAGRKLTLVLLDSAGKYSRFGDAERIRKWLLSAPATAGASLGAAAAPLR